KATVEGMYAEAAGIADENVRKALRTHALKSQSAQRLNAMIELAKTERTVVLPMSMIDTDPLLLGVENGVIDLRTGVFRPAEREDYITKRCGVAFDPLATCPNWDAFLRQILNAAPPKAAEIEAAKLEAAKAKAEAEAAAVEADSVKAEAKKTGDVNTDNQTENKIRRSIDKKMTAEAKATAAEAKVERLKRAPITSARLRAYIRRACGYT